MKNKPQKDIQFRRIRGRVVPIKVTKKNKEIARGAGYVLAGLGLSAAASATGAILLGKAAKKGVELKKFHKTASWLSNTTHKTKMGSKVEKIMTKAGITRGLAAMKLSKLAKNIHRGGLVAGALIAAAGVNELLRQNSQYEADVIKDAASHAGSGVALYASNLGFRKVARHTKLLKHINKLRFFK